MILSNQYINAIHNWEATFRASDYFVKIDDEYYCVKARYGDPEIRARLKEEFPDEEFIIDDSERLNFKFKRAENEAFFMLKYSDCIE